MTIKREHLTARVTQSVKEAAVRCAEDEGITLSTLVFEAVRNRVQNEQTNEKDEVQD